MIPEMINLCRLKISCLLMLFLFITASSYAQLPKEIRKIYKNKIDIRVSDEFDGNGEVDLSKWNYRQTKPNGIATGENFVRKVNGNLVCYGWKREKKAGGIVAKMQTHFGFIYTKFKVSGIVNSQQTVWHPSIWSGQCNGQTDATKECLKTGGNWLEIDMMEFENTPTARWSSDAPARLKVSELKKSVKVNDVNGRKLGYEKAVMIKKVTEGFHEWKRLGLEYHPEYLQLWEVKDHEWLKLGRRIIFDNKKPTIGSIPKACATPMFWYIGNLFNPYKNQKFVEEEVTNSTLEVDYFRFYPIKNE